MTLAKERAVEMIKNLPDDKVKFVINILEGLDGLYGNQEKVTASQRAYQNLQQYRRNGSSEIDYKEELVQALEEKYENLG
ncbi:MAG: dihydrodipicolinate reductase [Lachnospiraceae bacterium]|nr:dihydrodipicolinate reductase [Lachnospiraceae bacterium]